MRSPGKSITDKEIKSWEVPREELLPCLSNCSETGKFGVE